MWKTVELIFFSTFILNLTDAALELHIYTHLKNMITNVVNLYCWRSIAFVDFCAQQTLETRWSRNEHNFVSVEYFIFDSGGVKESGVDERIRTVTARRKKANAKQTHSGESRKVNNKIKFVVRHSHWFFIRMEEKSTNPTKACSKLVSVRRQNMDKLTWMWRRRARCCWQILDRSLTHSLAVRRAPL